MAAGSWEGKLTGGRCEGPHSLSLSVALHHFCGAQRQESRQMRKVIFGINITPGICCGHRNFDDTAAIAC